MRALFGQIGRLFWREMLQLFFFTLICFFALFVLIDYSSRAHGLPLKGLQWPLYYGALLVARLDLLVPFGLGIAAIRTVCLATQRYQITAMMASGRSLQSLLAPCVGIGLLFTGLLYCVDVGVWSVSAKNVRRVEDQRVHNKVRREGGQRVHALELDDGSLLLYRAYMASEERLQDVYWVLSMDALYRMDFLDIGKGVTQGQEVSYWQRDTQGQFIETEYASYRSFPSMQLDEALLNQVRTLPIDRSLQELWQTLPSQEGPKTQESSRIEAALYRRLSVPWLCFLACVAPLPFCARFRRLVPVVLIYSVFLALLGFVYVAHHALFILAENGLIPARESLAGTMLVLVLLASARFVRMRP